MEGGVGIEPVDTGLGTSIGSPMFGGQDTARKIGRGLKDTSSKGLSNLGTGLIGAGLDVGASIFGNIAQGRLEERQQAASDRIQSIYDEQDRLDQEFMDKEKEQQMRLQKQQVDLEELQTSFAIRSNRFAQKIKEAVEKRNRAKSIFSNVTQNAQNDQAYQYMMMKMGRME